ncbi:MAG: (E)-4-hydroxy-3-methylbut-2-enyl-diphosphate synthase [Bacteroidales bacterium]|nr:(E)-4-hydroxy-3-methylbut-2-enyl-diphosphate synthase [Bacteroidales bacterium]MBR1783187.1 (E)-4-hydroxy-3-methylbut-2-enyl-diphosphate synthase [Bacteroidales bacterium]
MKEALSTREVRVGTSVVIGSGHPIVVQTMCNTHTADVQATVAQCRRLAAAGSQLIRITVPSMADVAHLQEIHMQLRSEGIQTPLVADIHFSSEIAMAVVPVVEKIRINPGNFHPDHEKARALFGEFLELCKKYDRAIRIGLNHGSLGKYIVEKYGNTPEAMALAAMEWVDMCIDAHFYNVVVSLKASNTVVMVNAYRELARRMQERGVVFPLHVGVTEAGNGDSGRIKSCVAISTLLSEGIGNTIRVSLTEDPANELPVAQYLAHRFSDAPSAVLSEREETILKAACDWGAPLLNHEIDDVPIADEYLKDELLQACRRRFYKPEYIACPGCGRTLYNLEETFNKVKEATAGFKDVVIAVMGCIVNGPGEMADADYGYVGEGFGKVTLYRKKEPVLRHIPEDEAVEKLVELIRQDRQD